jgi:hypothetical protein
MRHERTAVQQSSLQQLREERMTVCETPRMRLPLLEPVLEDGRIAQQSTEERVMVIEGNRVAQPQRLLSLEEPLVPQLLG